MYDIFCSLLWFFVIEEGWEPFTSGSFYNAWKKPNVDYPDQNLYIYKGCIIILKKKNRQIFWLNCIICLVHGSYNDVTALDFMRIQLDIDNRKEWDNMSINLKIFDSEPLTHSDLIYWELRWPVIINI